jgi:hypothetical protein
VLTGQGVDFGFVIGLKLINQLFMFILSERDAIKMLLSKGIGTEFVGLEYVLQPGNMLPLPFLQLSA